jgi:hypothetical protein
LVATSGPCGGLFSARAPDHEVFLHVRKQKALFVTHDRAFTSPRKFAPKQTGGVIVLRLRHQEPDQEAPILDAFLKRHPSESLRGMTVLLYADRAIVRH